VQFPAKSALQKRDLVPLINAVPTPLILIDGGIRRTIALENLLFKSSPQSRLFENLEFPMAAAKRD
jgi:hypothetical protein